MTTVEKSAAWLRACRSHVEGVEIDPRGYVVAKVRNPVSPGEPFRLIVHPLHEKLVVKFLVPCITKVREGSALSTMINLLNYNLLLGRVGVDTDGEVAFEINHPCRDGEIDDPNRQVFKRLVDATCETVAKTARMLLHASMIEAGIPRALADDIMKTHFAEQTGGSKETI